jgi:methionine aminopeptidase
MEKVLRFNIHDTIVHEEIIRRGAYPSPLGYYGFPKSICTSVNNVICHGIPDEYTVFLAMRGFLLINMLGIYTDVRSKREILSMST